MEQDDRKITVVGLDLFGFSDGRSSVRERFTRRTFFSKQFIPWEGYGFAKEKRDAPEIGNSQQIPIFEWTIGLMHKGTWALINMDFWWFRLTFYIIRSNSEPEDKKLRNKTGELWSDRVRPPLRYSNYVTQRIGIFRARLEWGCIMDVLGSRIDLW